jgi:hypothetical protein
MLRLIQERGTIFELFRILQYTTPEFAAGLIGALDSGAVATLVDKTIKAGRSIGTLNFALRELADRPMPSGDDRTQQDALQRLLGEKSFWRLVEGAGDLNDLAYLLKDLSEGFRSVALLQENAPDVSRWRLLIRRGDFYCLARFARDGVRYLPSTALDSFCVAVHDEAADVARTSTWASLGIGLTLCEEIEIAPLRTLLEGAAMTRVEQTGLQTKETADFVESASRLRLLWRYREPLRPEITTKLWDHIPAQTSWPTDHELLIGGRLLLELRCPGLWRLEDANRLLEAFVTPLPARAFDKSDARLIWQFVWNLGAFCVERPNAAKAGLAEVWSVEAQERVLNRLGALVAKKPRTDEDRLHIFVPAGAIVYFIPQLTARIRLMLERKITGFPRLIEGVEAMSFVPAALATIGLALIGPPRIAFAESRLQRVIVKAADYEDRGPAIEQLIAHLQRVARR